ncbi:ABC1 kinase family protein [Saccharospirillum impatiens]|uniref:ABC1 kinase family protein n=1 Tax=Saccharospirillum impatiens TaxID=169438 RepID=UPI00040DF549|nr:AarF/ABC1/UbiB kinase family protein [Saccharospirillum impatiens]
MSQPKSRRLHQSRLGRFSQLGRLAGGVAGGMMSKGVKRWSKGEGFSARDLALTPGNLERVSDRLSQMRGAAMKVGQLVSMDAGHLMPAELSALLSRLRSNADALPLSQLDPVLAEAWGSNWIDQFSQFSYQPIAAASIGQVHKAVLRSGETLAIKVQYPGVRRSIDSDIDNVATLLRWSRLLPESLDLAPLLADAKAQLHAETDYDKEALSMQRFSGWLRGRDEWSVPRVQSQLTGSTVLAMSFAEGKPLESLDQADSATQALWVSRLFALFFEELFSFGSVQTDPNYANYLFDSERQQVTLLDFGAVRDYQTEMIDGYRALFKAAMDADRAAVFESARRIGYFSEAIDTQQTDAVIELFMMATEPLRVATYDFGRSDIAPRIREQGLELSMKQGYWHSPPVASLFLHRKLAGLYLLAQRLNVTLPVRDLLEHQFDPGAGTVDKNPAGCHP